LSPAESINGIQAEGVTSTLKHYTLNCNETSRHWLNAPTCPAVAPQVRSPSTITIPTVISATIPECPIIESFALR
jgi:hypothetical protein